MTDVLLPRYLRIGSSFAVRRAITNPVSGHVIFSAEALHFLPVVDLNVTVLDSITGGIGPVSASDSTSGTCYAFGLPRPLQPLPSEITSHPNWPRNIPNHPAFTLPRGEVTAMKCAWWHACRLITADAAYEVGLSLFGRKRAFAFLRAQGWPC